jgi:hypothetical protein
MFHFFQIEQMFKTEPSSVSDAVKLTGNLANNFKQIAEMLSSHLSKMNQIKSDIGSQLVSADSNDSANDMMIATDTIKQEMESDKKLISELIESTMNKKLDEIKHNIVTPLQHISFLNSLGSGQNNASSSIGGTGPFSLTSAAAQNLNKKIAQFQKNSAGLGNNSQRYVMNSVVNTVY